MTDRKRDEYGRAFYGPNEIPPSTERFAHWRGKLTSGYEEGNPGATHTPSTSPLTAGARQHDQLCVGGWIPSGEWWLHCGVCRPTREVAK